jgi:hypothetical protein
MRFSAGRQTGTGTQRALYEAAAKATLAPSILNTQPWRWRLHGETLDLFADPDRQVRSIDPRRRLLTLSCGAALQHACVALRADGLAPAVARLPDRAEPDLLARLSITGSHAATRGDQVEAGCLRRRHSDRRAIAARTPVNARDVDLLRQAAARHGAGLHLVSATQRPFLAMAAQSAQTIEARQDLYQEELVAWTEERPRGAGVPAETLVANIRRVVPLRDFAGGGETGLHPGLGDDTFADYLVLATPDDDPLDWLRGGEALSAVWLEATARTIAASVLSDVIEVPGARTLVASLLPEPAHPQLVLRIGIAAQPTPPPASPRRDPRAVIDLD